MDHRTCRAFADAGIGGFSLSRFLGKASTAVTNYGGVVTSAAGAAGIPIPGIVTDAASLLQRLGRGSGAAPPPATFAPPNGTAPTSAPSMSRTTMLVAAGIVVAVLLLRRR